MRARRDLLPADRAELLKAPTLTLAETALVLGVGLTALRDALRREEVALPVISIGTRKIVPTMAVRGLLGMDAATADESGQTVAGGTSGPTDAGHAHGPASSLG